MGQGLKEETGVSKMIRAKQMSKQQKQKPSVVGLDEGEWESV